MRSIANVTRAEAGKPKKPRRPRWHVSQAINKAKALAHSLKMQASVDGDEIAFSNADTGEVLLWWTGMRWRTEGRGAGMCRTLEVAVETAYDVMRGMQASHAYAP